MDGILTHTGPQEPATLEGKIVRIVDRVAYINHDIDDSIRYGMLEEEDLPRDEIAILGPTGAVRIDTLVHDLVEQSAQAGDIVQSEEVGGAMLSLRSFMFERVYLGPETRAEHARAHETIGRIVAHLRARGDSSDEIVEFVAGMTDRFALVVRCEPSLMPRLKDTTVESVKEKADFVELVEARTQLRKGGGGRYMGRCPFHEEKTPSFSVNGVDKLYYCFGCGAKGDLITFVRETEGLDFTGAIEWLADRFNVPVEYEESSPARTQRDAAASGCTPCSIRPRRTTRARCGRRRRDRPPATTSRVAASARRHAASFGSGLALGGNSLARKAPPNGFTAEELRAGGLLRRNGATTSPVGCCFRSPTRAAGWSGSRRAGSTTTIRWRQSTSTLPSRSCSTRARSSTGSIRRVPRSRGKTERAWSRGTPM